jgi:hypothetical protein
VDIRNIQDSEGTVRVLEDPETQQKKEVAVPSSILSESASEGKGEGDDVNPPQLTGREHLMRRQFLLSSTRSNRIRDLPWRKLSLIK